MTQLNEMQPSTMDRTPLTLHIPGKDPSTPTSLTPCISSDIASSLTPQPVLSVDELAGDETRMQHFLTSNYHLLCKKIFMSLDAFYSWLRSRGIFTIHDQQLVEDSYHIKLDKAGHLIDIITYNKGPDGFKAFMEVIEYEFPYVFTHLMGTVARKPPLEYRGSIPKEGSIERRSRAFWDKAMFDLKEASSKMTEEIIQRFTTVSQKAQETERMTVQSLRDEITTLNEEKVSLEGLAARYRVERDVGCAACRKYQQMKDTSNLKVIDLSQQVNVLQREMSRLKSGHWEKSVKNSVKKDYWIKEIRNMIEEHDSSQEHHSKELKEQLEQLKHERDDLFRLWKQEQGKREQSYIECTYYLEKAKQLENEMKQLIDVSYSSPRGRTCNLKDRKDLPSVISRKLVTPGSEVDRPFFSNGVDGGSGDCDDIWNEFIQPESRLMFQHPSSMVEADRSNFRRHPSPSRHHRRPDYLLPFPIQVMQRSPDAAPLLSRMLSSPETVELDADLLRQEVKLVGGSCAGIFVDELGKATDSNLNVGDKIMKMGQSLQDMYHMDGMTLEYVLTLVRYFSGSVLLSKLSNISGDTNLCNARDSQKVIHGDCFCVVIEKPIVVDDADWLPLELGTVVMVTETVHIAKRDGKTCWHGMKVNPKNGNLLQSGCLASGLKSTQHPSAERFNECGQRTLTRCGAVRSKSPQYVYVRPFKANYQRPVIVFSPDNIRRLLHESLLKLSASFTPYQTDHLFSRELDEFGEQMVDHLLSVASKRTQHLLLSVELEDIECLHSAGIHPIILLLQCTPPHLQTDMEKQQEKVMQKVLYRHEYELMSLESCEAADMDRLATRLEKQVHVMQSEVIWIRCSKVTAPF